MSLEYKISKHKAGGSATIEINSKFAFEGAKRFDKNVYNLQGVAGTLVNSFFKTGKWIYNNTFLLLVYY